MPAFPVTTVHVPHVGWLDFAEGDDVALFLREGWFEFREMAFLWLYLRAGDTVVDGGAHAGLFSALASRLVGPSGRVVAVEPNPDSAVLLRGNLDGNGAAMAKVVEAALYREDGTVALHRHGAGRSAYDSLYGGPEEGEAIEVKALTLDRLFHDEALERADFLKLDVEGAELDALAGAAKVLVENRLPLIMVEVAEANLRAAGRDIEALCGAFTAAGHSLCTLDPGTLQLVERPVGGPIWYDNLFACRDRDAVNARLLSAGPDCRRIAVDLLGRGQAAGGMKDRVEALRTQATEVEALAVARRDRIAQLEKLAEDRLARMRRAEARMQGLQDTCQAFEAMARERLMLLRRSHLQHRIAERRITEELVARWPLRLAFKYRLAQRPLWLAARQKTGEAEDMVARYIAEHPLESEPGSATDGPKVSVLLCTYNPRPDLLGWSLESIARQRLDPACYEVVLIDNRSDPPVDLADYPVARDMPIRVVREERPGLIFARLCGIAASTAPLIVFVDDDNFLDRDYLARALEIAKANPEIGLYGGIAHGRLEAAIARWKRPLLPFLGVRDNGSEPITSFEPHWGPWEPIGAGMAARREVADAYVAFVEGNAASGGLGRKGNDLMASEDSLFARIANQAGYACSYQPALELEHFITRERLTTRYLFRLIRGMGRSYVRLERVLGRGAAIKPIDRWQLSARFAYRLGREGLTGVLRWAWDVGYRIEARNEAETGAGLAKDTKAESVLERS